MFSKKWDGSTMLNLEYPNTPKESINGYIDLFDYENHITELLEDFTEARWALSNNPKDVEYKYRSCIVIAEMFTTAKQRLEGIIEWTNNGYKVYGNDIYRILDVIYTSVHWESTEPAPKPIINSNKYPKGFIIIDTGSFHERWTLICQVLTDAECEELYLTGI